MHISLFVGAIFLGYFNLHVEHIYIKNFDTLVIKHITIWIWRLIGP
jgi:hypothetical protein